MVEVLDSRFIRNQASASLHNKDVSLQYELTPIPNKKKSNNKMLEVYGEILNNPKV